MAHERAAAKGGRPLALQSTRPPPSGVGSVPLGAFLSSALAAAVLFTAPVLREPRRAGRESHGRVHHVSARRGAARRAGARGRARAAPRRAAGCPGGHAARVRCVLASQAPPGREGAPPAARRLASGSWGGHVEGGKAGAGSQRAPRAVVGAAARPHGAPGAGPSFVGRFLPPAAPPRPTRLPRAIGVVSRHTPRRARAGGPRARCGAWRARKGLGLRKQAGFRLCATSLFRAAAQPAAGLVRARRCLPGCASCGVLGRRWRGVGWGEAVRTRGEGPRPHWKATSRALKGAPCAALLPPRRPGCHRGVGVGDDDARSLSRMPLLRVRASGGSVAKGRRCHAHSLAVLRLAALW